MKKCSHSRIRNWYPNEELRNRIKSLENELQNSQDEIQALRESSLQMQLDSSDQLEQRDLENRALKSKLAEFNQKVQTEIKSRVEKYEGNH